MEQNTAPRCLFVNCKAPVTHRVYQTWNGKTVACCDKHVPGSKTTAPTGFYRVSKLDGSHQCECGNWLWRDVTTCPHCHRSHAIAS